MGELLHIDELLREYAAQEWGHAPKQRKDIEIFNDICNEVSRLQATLANEREINLTLRVQIAELQDELGDAHRIISFHEEDTN